MSLEGSELVGGFFENVSGLSVDHREHVVLVSTRGDAGGLWRVRAGVPPTKLADGDFAQVAVAPTGDKAAVIVIDRDLFGNPDNEIHLIDVS
jgi:hypothetical protein